MENPVWKGLEAHQSLRITPLIVISQGLCSERWGLNRFHGARDSTDTLVTPRDSSSDRPEPGKKGLASAYGSHATVGLQFALTILVFGALGGWLDSEIGTLPWLMIAGACLGMVGGFISLLKKFSSKSGEAEGDRSKHDS